MKIDNIVIVCAKRSAIGGFNGKFSDYPAYKIGRDVVKNMCATFNKNDITELIAGQVLTAGAGQNPARQTAIAANLPFEVPAFTVNQMCGSGLKSVSLAAQNVMLNKDSIIVAGGQENMSMAPHIAKLRNLKMGNINLIDSMVYDGLIDAFWDYHMGITAENLVKRYKITRESQDKFAYNSHKKACKGLNEGKFNDEIVPIEINGETFNQDESIRFNVTIEGLMKLNPVFQSNGSVTAGNSSPINDGAAFVVLMNERKAKEMNLEILGKIISIAESGIEPEIMGIAPVCAVKKALSAVNWKIKDIDVIEVSEAFASQSLAVARELELDMEKLNINGGAIALGHPIGASGARCLVTLLHIMKQKNARKGLVSACIGGGMGIAMCIEK